MPSRFPYRIDDTSFSVFVGGKLLQTDRSNPNFSSIVDLVNSEDTTEEQLANALKPIGAVAEALNGVVDVHVFGSSVLVNGEEIHSSLATRVLDIVNAGLDVQPWVRFVQNIFANPLKSAQDEFYDWYEVAKMPITSDGCFLAYKIVGEDYRDLYSHSYDNSVGQVVVLKGGRAACDDNRNRTCSSGLHFCSKDYLPQYGVGQGSRVMIVKINPADVVSFPTDSGLSKGRTWRYEVVGEISREQAGLKAWLPIDTTWDSEEDEPEFEAYEDEIFDDEVVSFEEDLDSDGEPFVTTKGYGQLTPSKLSELRDNNGGSNRALARALGVPIGTIGGWIAALRKKGAQL